MIDQTEALKPEPHSGVGASAEPPTGGASDLESSAEMLEDVRSLLLTGEVTPGTFRPDQAAPAPAATLPPLPTCPECKAGKHSNCDDTAWDDAHDVLTSCGCTHAGTTQPDGGTR